MVFAASGLTFFFGLALGGMPALAEGNQTPPVIEPCPQFKIVGKLDPGLSDMEKRLVCGDPQSQSWKDIPLNQAKFSFKTFMQDRALYHVRYIEEKDHLIAEVGDPTIASSVTVEGAPPDLEMQRQRQTVGRRMTPSLLDTIEQWTLRRLSSIGFPCPKVKSVGDPDTGEIHLTIDPGPRQNLMAVREVNTPGLDPGVLRRYDAFKLGARYNGDDLVTTSNRIVNQGLFDSSFFVPSCTDKGAVAAQEVVASPPRLLSLGAGVNTEEIVVGRARWTQSRLGLHASDVSTQLYGSLKSQQISAYADAYVFDPGSRQAIRPSISLDHENWNPFETATFSTQIAHETSWDGETAGLKLITGPQIDFIRTFREAINYSTGIPQQPNTHFLSMMSTLSIMSHGYEYFANANRPQTGYTASANVAVTDGSFLSTTSVQRLNLRWETLRNFRDYDPPLWVFGFRGGYSATVTGQRPTYPSNGSLTIPPTYLNFLGGSQDLRGFGVQELGASPPGTPSESQVGQLTTAFVSFETRLVSILPFGIEPFGFVDAGELGSEPWQIRSPLYWDPGLGLRLQSPIGVFRTTGAYGFVGNDPDHFQFYFSFGQEF